MNSLYNKNVIITGGTHGIGATTAKLFYHEGANVVIVGRDEEKADKIIKGLNGNRMTFKKCDLTQRNEVLKLANWIKNSEITYNVLINNASKNSRYNITNITLQEWDAMIELNLTSTLILSSAFVHKLKIQKKPGKIINIGAIQSLMPLESSLAYSTVKGALRSMTKSMAIDLAPFNILVSLVIPGPIYAKSDSDEPPKDLDSRAATLLGRMGRKIEVAKLLKFLSSDDNSFMTGNEIIIDGGRLISRKPDPTEIKNDII